MKKKLKRKLTKAELAAQANYDKMMARWDKMPKFSSTTSGRISSNDSSVAMPSMAAPAGRPSHHDIPSRVTPGGSTAKRPNHSYTGTKVMGIATLHKSIAQPVFSQEEARDAATMRRN